MPQILPSSCWVEFRSAAIIKTLNEAALHFAIVRGADGKERKCAVKLIDMQTSPGLLCEGLGWLIAQAAGVNVSSFAGVLMVPIAELGSSMALPNFVHGHSEYPAWCVEVVAGTDLSQVHKWIFWVARIKCLLAKNTAVIAAFDYWTDNQDRNYGNVIRSKSGQYIAIDHESLLHEAIWRKYFGIQFTLNSLLREATLHLPPSRLHEFKFNMALAANIHEAALHQLKAAASQFVHAIIPDAAFASRIWSEIDAFLAPRAANGWLANELGVIV
jgi:hypothetical protein